MKLKQGELIALYRSRKGWTQKMLGEKLFPELSAPHVKMRKIEAGIQKPTDQELEDISAELGIYFDEIDDNPDNEDFIVSREALEYFPKLKHYLESINLAAKIKDPELIKFTFKKMEQYIKKVVSY